MKPGVQLKGVMLLFFIIVFSGVALRVVLAAKPVTWIQGADNLQTKIIQPLLPPSLPDGLKATHPSSHQKPFQLPIPDFEEIRAVMAPPLLSTIPRLIATRFNHGQELVRITFDEQGQSSSEILYQTGDMIKSVMVEDIDHDRNEDIIFLLYYNGSLVWLRGLADGSFAPPAEIPVGTGPVAMIPGDWNRDGQLDVAVSTTYDVRILFNQGQGQFVTQAILLQEENPGVLESGDIDRDGDTDLIVALPFSREVVCLKNDGTGSLQIHSRYETGNGPVSLSLGDLDGDYYPEIAVLNGFGGDLRILGNLGDGFFSEAGRYDAGESPMNVKIHDQNQDGQLDLVLDSAESVFVLSNQGDGKFSYYCDLSYDLGVGPFTSFFWFSPSNKRSHLLLQANESGRAFIQQS